eukprot:TRINITY_DN26587_c0_g1_i1.p1 TRINITY_DN26587_c0_g1~~TRINITY_DN26587_c0_g1_i1.p1  ORF type:complete len:371 (+),score=115.80 TRINITY_DN26587_c0_g1_i1:115-1227(+)
MAPRSLADIVLAAPRADVEAEEAELQRQIDEIRAQRLSSSSRAGTPVTGVAAANSSSCVGAAPACASTPADESAAAATASPKPRSLADEILARAANRDVEREMAAMDEELQQQLASLRKQGGAAGSTDASASASAAAPAAPAAATTAEAPAPADAGNGAGRSSRLDSTAGWTTTASRGALAAASRAAASEAAVTSSPDASPASEEVPAELSKLLREAAELDQAFPDDGDGSALAGEAPTAAERRRRRLEERSRLIPRQRGGGGYGGAAGDAAEEATEVTALKGALVDLDVKLRALQQRQSLQPELARPALAESASSGAAMLAAIRVQNEHLRARLSTPESRRGVFNLDRSLFGGDAAGANAPAAIKESAG